MNTCSIYEPRIDNLVELTSICRSEWCRSLEVEMDELDMVVHDGVRPVDGDERLCLDKVSKKFRQGYKNLSPIFIA